MLAIAGGKGGCGKTTVALGVARALANRGRRPLVIDADVDMPDLHHYAGIDRGEGVDAVARGRPLAETIQWSTAVPGVALLTAGTPEHTRTVLRGATAWEGPVLIDCPAGIGPDAVWPFRLADRTLVVSTNTPQCLEDTRRSLSVASQLETRPVGVIVRTDAPAGVPDRVGTVPVVETLPTVDMPLDNEGLWTSWQRIGALVDNSE